MMKSAIVLGMRNFMNAVAVQVNLHGPAIIVISERILHFFGVCLGAH